MTTFFQRAAVFLVLTTSFLTEPAAFGQAPRRDGNGDLLPEQAVARLGTPRWRHGAAVTTVVPVPNGRELLTDSEDGTLRLWDLASGTEVRRFRKASAARDASGNPEVALILRGPGHGAAVSHDGRTVAAGAADGTITLWDLATAQVVRTLKLETPTPIAALRFAADDELLVVKDDEQVVWVFDLARGLVLRKFGAPDPANNRFGAGSLTGAPTLLAGGTVVATVTLEQKNRQLVQAMKRWDLATGRERGPLVLSSGGNFLSAAAFAPDGKTLALAGFRDSVHLWDLEAGKELRPLQGLDMTVIVSRLAFAPDGRKVAGWASDQTIRLWDAATGKELRRLGEPRGSLLMGIYFFGGTQASNLAFSLDGSVLAVGLAGGVVQRWEVGTGKELLETNSHRDRVHGLVLSADGKTAVSSGADGSVRVWDLGSGAELRHFALPSDVTETVFAPNGQTVAAGNPAGMVSLWDVTSGKELRQWQATRGGFAGLAFSADGKVLATRSYDQVLDMWDPATGKQLRSIGEALPGAAANGNDFLRIHFGTNVPNIFFAADGTTLAAVPPADGPAARFGGRRRPAKAFAIRLWDVTTGKSVRPFDPRDAATTAFACAADGRLLAAALTDGSVSLWETASGKVRLRTSAGPGGTVSALAFSSDSRVLAGGDDNATIRLWDTLSGAEIGRLTGHQGKIHALAFSADGTRLVSGSADTSLLVWDVAGLGKERALRSVAVEDGREEALWEALAIGDPARAHRAAVRLIAAPGQAVPLLRERLRPVVAPGPDKVAELLTNLDNRQLAVRQRASAELEKLGELIEPALKQALADQPSLERQKRLEQLQERLVSGTALAAEQLQGLRAVEVLERVGTPEARDVLRLLAGGASGARLTRQAQAALGRLGKP